VWTDNLLGIFANSVRTPLEVAENIVLTRGLRVFGSINFIGDCLRALASTDEAFRASGVIGAAGNIAAIILGEGAETKSIEIFHETLCRTSQNKKTKIDAIIDNASTSHAKLGLTPPILRDRIKEMCGRELWQQGCTGSVKLTSIDKFRKHANQIVFSIAAFSGIMAFLSASILDPNAPVISRACMSMCIIGGSLTQIFMRPGQKIFDLDKDKISTACFLLATGSQMSGGIARSLGADSIDIDVLLSIPYLMSPFVLYLRSRLDAPNKEIEDAVQNILVIITDNEPDLVLGADNPSEAPGPLKTYA
jgi:ribosomal protein L25 (general stress protein Ctc)